MNKSQKLLNLILPVITVACLLLLWTFGYKAVGSEYILPSVKSTIVALKDLMLSAKFYTAFFLTLIRSLIAFSISFFLAFIMAYLSIKVKFSERVILTVVSILRALPTLSVVLLLLFWTNSQVAPVVVTLLVVLPTAYTQIKGAFEAVSKNVIEAGKIDGANTKQLLFRIELPQILPQLLNVIGSGISLNFKLMVAAEVISATVKSLGSQLNIASYNGDIAKLLAMVSFAVIFGILIEFIFNKISNKIGEWK